VTKDTELLPRFQWLWLTLGWMLALVLGAGSLAPSVPSAAALFSDKFLHFGAYASLAFLFAGALGRRRWKNIALGLLLFGAALELLQQLLTATRMGEWWDLAANAGGIATGLLLAALIPGNWCRRVEAALGLAEARQ